MSKINILDSFIFNRIAAGEVVARPASVVKELVENSIDGAASNISISIIGGGIKQIVISDNGCGIAFDDIETAFLPHATSKISKIDDLDSISTLGFRGEALASIAAVSQITVKSKQQCDELGVELDISGGVFSSPKYISANNGTSITVNNLFFNTPARAKFLKAPKSEESEITSIISQLILANPKLEFKYIVENKIIYQTNGSGLNNAIYAVYGKDIFNNLIMSEFKYHDIRINGYISKSSMTKSNRSYQTLIINGRVVTDKTIPFIVSNAYGNLLMRRTFPIYILDILMPFEDLDVNVHPSKSEVRFKSPNIINSAIYKYVKNALRIDESILPLNNDGLNNTIPFDIASQGISNDSISTKISSSDDSVANDTNTIEKHKQLEILLGNSANTSVKETNIDMLSLINYNRNTMNKIESVFNKIENFDEKNSDDKKNTNEKDNFESDLNNNERTTYLTYEKNEIQLNYKIIGQLFNCYLLLENNEKLIIIDQHAAHEKILYDKLINIKNTDDESSQLCLVPYVISLASKDFTYIMDNKGSIESLGFDFDEFGNNTIKINVIPMCLPNLDVKRFFDDIVSDETYLRKISKEQLLEERFAMIACKAAVKAGAKLSVEYIENLIVQLINNKTVLKCPHGRPIIVFYGKNDIDKWFKRVL